MGLIEKFIKMGSQTDISTRKIRLFIKPYCGWCDKATRWLDDREVQYETIDVMADEAAFEEMIRISGQEMAPVLEVDGKVLADFGPEELPGFFEKLKAR
jgi:glutaredoxin 3